jgi:hypothetical protein
MTIWMDGTVYASYQGKKITINDTRKKDEAA